MTKKTKSICPVCTKSIVNQYMLKHPNGKFYCLSCTGISLIIKTQQLEEKLEVLKDALKKHIEPSRFKKTIGNLFVPKDLKKS